jgi:hypothetical protein
MPCDPRAIHLAAVALVAVALAFAGCFHLPEIDGDGDGDSDGDSDGDGDGDGDVVAGPVCPEDEPHLVIGLRSTDWDQSDLVLRRDARLRPCRGTVIQTKQTQLSTVGGTSNGYDLLGFSDGAVMIYDDGVPYWDFVDAEGHPALALFSIEFDGLARLAVVWGSWGSSTPSATSFEVRYLEDGTEREVFSVTSELSHASPTLDGAPERIAGLIWNGVQEYTVTPGADALGSTSEPNVATPWTSGFRWIVPGEGQMLVASRAGVLYWPPETSPAFLGPVTCRWPAVVDGPVPDGEEEYLSVAADLGRTDRFLTVVDGYLEGSDRSSTYLFRISARGECELILEAPPDHEIVGIAWTGI